MTRLRSFFIIIVILVAVTLAGTTPATAWYHAGGGGHATANVATLVAPSNVLVSGTSETSGAHVTWDAAVAPTGTVDGYYVSRTDGTTNAAACATSATTLVI